MKPNMPLESNADFGLVHFVLALVLAGHAGTPFAQAGPEEQAWIRDLTKSAMAATVTVTVEGRPGDTAALGAGFVVSSDGLIATNLHTIGEARPIKVQFSDGREFWVTEVHASDRDLDLALLRIPATNLKTLDLANPSWKAEQGAQVVALGNPMGLRNSVVHGIISGVRDIGGLQMIQIAMPIERGNSGGPLLNRDGKVVGIVTLKSAMTANLGFAVHVDSLRSLIDQPNPIAMTRWQTIGLPPPKQWEVMFGAKWRQHSGQIVVSQPGAGFGGRSLCLHHKATPEGDFEVATFAKLEDESGAAGLVFASDGNQRHYGFYPSAGRLRLTRFDGPTVYSWTVLKEFSSEHYRPGDWNHLKVRLTASQLECYVNDQLVLTWPVGERPSGRVGLAKFRDTEATFRGFAVGERLPPSRPRLDTAGGKLIDRFQQTPWSKLPDLDALVEQAEASRVAIELRLSDLESDAERLRSLKRDVHILSTIRRLLEVIEHADRNENRPSKTAAQSRTEALERDGASDLAEAALLVSKLDNVDLNIESYLARLAEMADEIQSTLNEKSTDEDRLKRLNEYLFRENGFHGSRTNYYHAANSYLDRVIDDREGLPLTLSILYLDLGRRIGLQLEGVGLPGHFVVRHRPSNGDAQLLDIFDGASPLTLEQAGERVKRAKRTRLTDEMLAPTSTRAMIVRMLGNLQGVASEKQNASALLGYLEASVELAPDDPQTRAMRAIVRHQTGWREAAVRDLDRILEDSPPGFDLRSIRALRENFTRRNSEP